MIILKNLKRIRAKKMAKDPTIPFYAQDFYLDTVQWSEAEVGAYIRLLCTLWINGFCYNSAIDLANVSPLAKQVVDKYPDKFIFYDDNKFSSKRLEEERDKRIKNRELRSVAGKRGAEKRWQKDSKHHGKKIANVNGKEKEKELINIEFEKFWDIYDHKINKKECELLWISKKKTKFGDFIRDSIRTLIMEHLIKYIPNTNKDGTYPSRKYPHTYLYGECWNDEVVESEKKQPQVIAAKYFCKKCKDYQEFPQTEKQRYHRVCQKDKSILEFCNFIFEEIK